MTVQYFTINMSLLVNILYLAIHLRVWYIIHNKVKIRQEIIKQRSHCKTNIIHKKNLSNVDLFKVKY